MLNLGEQADGWAPQPAGLFEKAKILLGFWPLERYAVQRII